jgi:hypothetical protein
MTLADKPFFLVYLRIEAGGSRRGGSGGEIRGGQTRRTEEERNRGER